MDRLNEMLAEATPPIAPRDQRLREALNAVIAERMHARNQHRRHVVVGATAGFVLLFAGTSAALASPSLQNLLGQGMWDNSTEQVNDAGKTCAAGWRIGAEPGVAADDPAVVEAQRVLQIINPQTIPVDPDLLAREQGYSSGEADAARARGEDPAQLAWNDPAIAARWKAVTVEVFDELTDRGVDVSKLNMEGSFACDTTP